MADLSKYGTVTTAGPGRGGYAPVDISKYGTVSKATENPNQPFSEKYPQLGAVVGAAGDFAQSAGSSAFESIMGAYKLIRMVPGVGDRLPPPSEFTEALTHGPDTIAGHAGKMVESMGEFMIPAGKVEQMQKGASLIARMAGQGGAAGVVRMIQSGGDVGSSLDTAAMGAAGPVIGAVIGAMTPKAVELAKAAGMKIGLSVAGRLTGLPIKGIHDLIVRGAGIAPEVAAAIGKDAELLDGIAQGYGYKSFAKVPESGQQLIRNQATAIANSIAGEAAPVAAAPAAVPPAGVTPSGPVRPPVATAAQMMREAETFRPPETFVPGGPLRPPVRPAPASAATPAAAAAPAEMPALEQITEWLINRDGGTASRFTDPVVSEAPITKQTLGDIMDRLMKNRKVPAEVPPATVPAEVPPAAVETPQPATPAPSAAGKPVTAATLMEEVAKPAAQVTPQGPVRPPLQSAVTAGKSLAELLRDEMLANGSITEAQLSVPEASAPVTPAGKVAIADMMRDLPKKAGKAMAKSNYAGNQDPQIAKVVYEAGSRADKVKAMADVLRDGGYDKPEIVDAMKPEHWKAVADKAGVHPPGSDITIAEVKRNLFGESAPDSFQELRDMIKERAGKKVPPFDWGDEAQFREYQKALVEDSNIYGNNRTTMADRVTRFMKKNGIEPTDSGIVRALNESAEEIAVSPTTGLKRPSFNAADHEVLFDMIKDRLETPTGGNPAASAAPKPPAKPRSKRTTVGELMEKAKVKK